MWFLKLGRYVQHLVVGLALGAAMSSTNAVQLNPSGVGQVLIYPYFTVQTNEEGQAYNSLLTVINNRPEGKAVKVRIRERQFGEEIASFNLMLPANDV